MKLSELIHWLETRQKFKPKTDLNKMIHATKLLNNPQYAYKTIHITGTNGKGSTAKYIESVLKQQFKVGSFTSPYIVKFNERIQINGNSISDEDLFDYIRFIKRFDEDYLKEYKESFSFFELLTLMAYQYFKDKQVDYAIIEVGIGGLLDATNVLNSTLSIITSLGFDHQDQLGNTLEAILIQKLGIVKKDSTLVTSLKEYSNIIDAYVKNISAKVIYVDNSDYKLIKTIPLEIMYKNNLYTSNLLGLYQINNLIIVIESLKHLIPKINEKTLKKGIFEAKNPGRFELFNLSPKVILDGAHNLEAVKKVVESINYIYNKDNVKILFTSMADKPFDDMLDHLSMYYSNIYLTSLGFPRAISDFSLLEKKYRVIKNPIEAYETIRSESKDDDVILVIGSMYLISEIRKYIKENN